MERQQEVQNVNNGEEIYVTNAAIKTTDVLMTIAAGAFALAGIGSLLNTVKKRKQLKENEDFETRIITNLIKEGCTEQEIENARNLIRKYC